MISKAGADELNNSEVFIPSDRSIFATWHVHVVTLDDRRRLPHNIRCMRLDAERKLTSKPPEHKLGFLSAGRFLLVYSYQALVVLQAGLVQTSYCLIMN